MKGRFSLLICNNGYQETVLPNFNNSKEFNELQDIFDDPEIGYFNSKLLANKTIKTAKSELENICINAGAEDTILIYFNGHGFRDDFGKFYFGMNSTVLAKLDTTAISASFIKDLLNKSIAKKQIVILDCCMSGSFSQEFLAKNKNHDYKVTDLFNEGQGRVIMASSDSVSNSYVGKKVMNVQESYFTKYLIEGLKTGEADYFRNGYISAHEIFLYITEKLQKDRVPQSPTIDNHEWKKTIYLAKNIHYEKPLKNEEDIKPNFRSRVLPLIVKMKVYYPLLVGFGYFFAFTSLSIIIYWGLNLHGLLTIVISILIIIGWKAFVIGFKERRTTIDDDGITPSS